MRDLATLRDEVADAAELAADHYKTRFDERTSTWKDEELLLPGKKVWLEMRGAFGDFECRVLDYGVTDAIRGR